MSLQKYHRMCAAIIGLATVTGAYAQISTINSAIIRPRVFNDVPGSTVTISEVLYPGLWPASISLGDSGVSAPSGFANRHVWAFSSDGGASAYQFQNNDYFQMSFDLTLTANPITPRREAGFLFSTATHGDIQFIVNTDGHEVVQFGGVGFYSFNVNNGITYNSGDTIRLGMTYFLDSNGHNALIFTANGVNSPVQEFALGDGIGNGSTLGGYFQIVNDPNNPNNSGLAVFQNISLTAVPEPSVIALVGLGVLSLLMRRRS